jgi:hypothetical protein
MTVSGGAARDIGAELDALTGAVQDKLALVEYFKSDNALLRNSSTYFVHAGQRLGERLSEPGPVPAAEITALSHSMLRLMQSPDPTAEEEARRALDRLSRAPTRAAEGRALTTHGTLIVQMLPGVDALVRRIIAAPIPARASALEAVVGRHADGIDARAQVFRILLYLVAVVLVGSMLYHFIRLRANARVLRRANVNLQREVAERRRAAAALRTSEERWCEPTEAG